MTLRVMAFRGAHNLPLWTMDRGIDLRWCESLAEQLSAVRSGEVDVIHTAPDNLAREDAEGLSAFLGGTVGPLDLVAGPGGAPWRLAVDDPRSGFGPLAAALLRRLRPGEPVEVVPVGGTRLRYRALVEGAATLAALHPPFTEWAIERGFRRLGRIDAPGSVTLVAASRLERLHEPAVVAYGAAYREAVERLRGARGADIAREVIARNLGLRPPVLDAVSRAMREAVVAAGSDPPQYPLGGAGGG